MRNYQLVRFNLILALVRVGTFLLVMVCTKTFNTKILGLDICADTLVGDEMLKGISGGQKKRLTTGIFCDILTF